MNVPRSLNLGLAFALEMAMLAAFAVFGFRAVDHAVVRWIVAAALPLAVAVLWGVFLAPKAARRLSTTPGILVSLALFLLAALALHRSGYATMAWLMAGAAVLHAALALRWRQW